MAQITNTWIGGCPGHETDYNFYKNWSTNQVPDWSSDVVIPNKFSDNQYFPVIAGEYVEVNSLYIHAGAELTIKENAYMAVLNEDYKNEPLVNMGEILVYGKLGVEDKILNNRRLNTDL